MKQKFYIIEIKKPYIQSDKNIHYYNLDLLFLNLNFKFFLLI